MRLTLEPTKDILSLYTPFASAGKARVDHTRSVLLKQQKDSTAFTIVSSVCFALVISMPKSVPIEYLLRYMLSVYNSSAYALSSKTNDMNRHAAMWKPESEVFIEQGIKNFVHRVDKDNRSDYETVMKRRLFAAENKEGFPWHWQRAGSMEIEDEEYREMRNINFIRDVKQVSAFSSDKKTFQNDAQYRIVFDNHLILHFFLRQFRYGSVKLEHKEEKFDCRIVLLDPVACSGNRHEKFESTNYIYYIEKQLNCNENRDFHQTLHFGNVYPCVGGILHPSAYETNDTLHLHQKNTVEAMLANSFYEDTSGQRLSKKQQEASKGFRLRYNRFYVDLSTEVQTHVEYIEREKTLISQKIVAKPPKKKAVTAEAVKEERKATSASTRYKQAKKETQPTLLTVVANIPEKSKRKAPEEVIPEPELPTPSPAKKPRLEQANLKSFFFNQ